MSAHKTPTTGTEASGQEVRAGSGLGPVRSGDQGKEIAGHENLAAATGLDVFVCDRSSLWQRGTNENTTGLLRQWWPGPTNFYTLELGEVCRVQTSINARSRAALEWQSPARALELAISRS
ncbi:transposase [uncultured Ilumatobacter sp.]|uniref:transposase n=1 Tax=uncultured Ilumatobacter sp. TaxID=879968 RepID=UPI00374F2FF5